LDNPANNSIEMENNRLPEIQIYPPRKSKIFGSLDTTMNVNQTVSVENLMNMIEDDGGIVKDDKLLMSLQS
jgi:hypothetical protein